MDLKGREVRDPDERIEVVAEDKMHVPPCGLREMGEDVHVLRCSCGSVLLKEPLPPGPVREPVHGQRPVPEKREQERRHPDIVGEYVTFRDAGCRVQHLVEPGEPDSRESIHCSFFRSPGLPAIASSCHLIAKKVSTPFRRLVLHAPSLHFVTVPGIAGFMKRNFCDGENLQILKMNETYNGSPIV